MEPLSDPKWETELAQELRKLPDREAPATLIPRVMAALQARVRLPWWRRTWWQWPPAAQLLGLLAVSSVLGLITYYATRGWEAALVAGMTQQVQAWLEPLRPAWSCLVSLANALALVLRQAGQLVFLAVGACSLAAYVSCVGLGTAVYRVVVRRSSLKP